MLYCTAVAPIYTTRIHFQRGTLPSAEDDGGKQSEGRPAPADRGQDDYSLRQGEFLAAEIMIIRIKNVLFCCRTMMARLASTSSVR